MTKNCFLWTTVWLLCAAMLESILGIKVYFCTGTFPFHYFSCSSAVFPLWLRYCVFVPVPLRPPPCKISTILWLVSSHMPEPAPCIRSAVGSIAFSASLLPWMWHDDIMWCHKVTELKTTDKVFQALQKQLERGASGGFLTFKTFYKVDFRSGKMKSIIGLL